MRRYVWKLLLAAVVLLAIAGVAAPYIKADQYREQIRSGLERGFGRKVQIGSVHFSLFTGPGFTVEDVIIGEDPSIGIEPFAHMPELEARVNIGALLTGRIEFARVRFVQPSVNVAKTAGGRWNIVPLLERTVRVPGTASAELPEIQVSDGRINFKQGDRKAPLYFLNSDVTIAPRSSEQGAYVFHFSGEPARTDRAAIGYGELTASGRLLTAGPGEKRVEIDVRLVDGDLKHLSSILQEQPLGLHGLVNSRAKVWGPLSNIQLLGTMNVREVHRWDEMPTHGDSMGFQYRGSLNVGLQQLEFSATPQDNPGLPFSARLVGTEVLSQPKWSSHVVVQKMPATSVIEVVRHLGAPIPSELNVKGDLEGVIDYEPQTGLHGQLALRSGSVRFGGGPPFAVENAALLIEGDEIRLPNVALAGPGRSAELATVYNTVTQLFEATIRGKDMMLAELKSGGSIGGRVSPAVEHLDKGSWTGELRFIDPGNGPSSWTADLVVKGAVTKVPGLAKPVEIRRAQVSIRDADIVARNIELNAGSVEGFGEYRYTVADNKHSLRLAVPTLTALALEQLLGNSPAEGMGGFLSRTFGRNREASQNWLRHRNADLMFEVGTFEIAGTEIHRMTSQGTWRGEKIEISRLTGVLDSGTLDATGSVDLAGREASYRLQGKISGLDWQGGEVDIAGAVQTSGSAAEMLLNLKSTGTFEARSVDVAPEYEFRTVAGTYDVRATPTGPNITLSAMRASVGREKYAGQGATLPDGRLRVELASASRVMQLTGPMTPLRLEVTTGRLAGHTR